MPITNKTFAGALIALAMLAGPAGASQSVDLSNPAFAPTTGPTSIPIGAAEFCKAHRADCGPSASVVEVETLTDRGWQQLVSINDAINTSVLPVTDKDLYRVNEFWTYPAGKGDCEDFALEKRRHLIANGWEPSALLMTVVRQQNGEGHAVLMVRTDRGDLVLDNQDGRVLVWNDTPYQFIKRQSQTDSRKWVGIDDTRIITASATR
ncbi:MAG: transglutaminase-like cysteine peptidase [Devosia sp.]